MNEYMLHITEDEALVLFEFFARFGESDKLEFAHPAEYIALMKVAGQIEKTTSAMFDPDYIPLLQDARDRLAEGFEGNVPKMKAGT